MTTEPPDHPDLAALTRETRSIWDGNADFWDGRYGEGNAFQRTIVGPPTERLLAIAPGERVLDVACGNGAFSRHLASLGAEVVAFDFSERFIALARERTAGHPQADRITYSVLDATDPAQLATLGERRFDAAVATMALMDMTTITPLFAALARALKPGGRFVCSVSHPCFHSTATNMVIEQEERDGEIVLNRAIKVTRYLDIPPTRGIGILGQPATHYYFDRPFSVLFGEGFRAGFVLDGLEEPADPEAPNPARPFAWGNFRSFPMALVARFRLPRA